MQMFAVDRTAFLPFGNVPKAARGNILQIRARDARAFRSTRQERYALLFDGPRPDVGEGLREATGRWVCRREKRSLVYLGCPFLLAKTARLKQIAFRFVERIIASISGDRK